MKDVLISIVLGLPMVTVMGCADQSADEPVAIIPIGDSITNRVGASTYRCYLDQMLHEAGVEFDFVGGRSEPASSYTCPTEFDLNHEGVSGASVTQRAGPALESVELLEPDVALVLLGGNDLNSQQPPDEVADELSTFIQDLQAAQPDMTIFVAQYPPCRSSSSWCQDDWPALNAAIATFDRLSTDRSEVVVVDMNTDFSLDLLHDAVHPNDAGDEEMARRWMSALIEAGIVDATS